MVDQNDRTHDTASLLYGLAAAWQNQLEAAQFPPVPNETPVADRWQPSHRSQLRAARRSGNPARRAAAERGEL